MRFEIGPSFFLFETRLGFARIEKSAKGGGSCWRCQYGGAEEVFQYGGVGFFLNFLETENKPRRERAGSASEFGKEICKLNPVYNLLPSLRNPIAGF